MIMKNHFPKFDTLYFNIIYEAMMPIEDLPPNTKITITKSKYYNNGYELRMFIEGTPVAGLELYLPHGKKTWNIHAGMRAEHQGKGFGPLLYDIALEFITNYKNSIVLSTYGNGEGSITSRAENVWKKYYLDRKDVKHIDNIGSKKDIDGFMNFPDEERSPKNTPWLWAGYTKELSIIPKLINQKVLTISNYK